jgi:hypothetical protein
MTKITHNHPLNQSILQPATFTEHKMNCNKMLKNKTVSFLIILAMWGLAALLLPGFQGKIMAQVSWSGFIENYNAFTTSGGSELISGRNQARLNQLAVLGDGRTYLSGDIRNTYSSGEDLLQFSIREAWIDIFFENSDLRIGRQLIVWGQADGAFIADIVTPVDFSEFLTRSFDDLRTGVDAVSWTRYFGSSNLQFVVNPVFRANSLPDPGSRWDLRPPLPELIEVTYNSGIPDSYSIRDTQLAARLSLRPSPSSDVDLGLLYWSPGLPVYRKSLDSFEQNGFRLPDSINLTGQHRQTLIVTGATVFRLSNSTNFTSELAWYRQRDFDYLPGGIRLERINELLTAETDGLSLQELLMIAGETDLITRQLEADSTRGLLRTRPQLVGMAGVKYNGTALSASFQYIGEYIVNHDEGILQDQYYQSVTLLLRRTFRRETMSVNVFGRYNLNGRDFWINPEWQYRIRDNIALNIGGHFFGGEQPGSGYGHVSFRNFAGNSFGFMSVRATW